MGMEKPWLKQLPEIDETNFPHQQILEQKLSLDTFLTTPAKNHEMPGPN